MSRKSLEVSTVYDHLLWLCTDTGNDTTTLFEERRVLPVYWKNILFKNIIYIYLFILFIFCDIWKNTNNLFLKNNLNYLFFLGNAKYYILKLEKLQKCF